MTVNNRKIASREKSKLMLIIVDGESEETYFNSDLFDEYSHVRIVPRLSGKSGACKPTVDLCVKEMKKRNLSINGGDRAIIVTDVDEHSDDEITSMNEQCLKKSIELHISNCSFEVWLLMHYHIINRWYEKDELNKEISKNLGHKYVKSRGISPSTSMVQSAISNGKGMINSYSSRIEECLKKDRSRTTIHLLISSLDEYR